MIQATAAIADFMVLLIQAAFWVVLWAAGWTLLAVAGVACAFFGGRAIFRRLRGR